MLNFDLSSIPSNATITSATLEIYYVGLYGAYKTNTSTFDNAGTFTLYKVTKSWDESGSANWSSHNSSFDNSSVDTYSYQPNSTTWADFDVTSAIQGMVDGSADKYGFVIHTKSPANDNATGGWGGCWTFFASSDTSDQTIRPKLTVTYETGGGSDTENPVVSVTAPTSSSSYEPGDQIDISWNATDNVGVKSVKVEYSTDGSNWTEITGISGNSHSWTAPSTESDSYRIRVTAEDDAGNTGSDTSDLFSVKAVAVIDTVNPSANLIEWCGWGALVDDYGSSCDTGTALIENEKASVDFAITGSDSVADKWAWGSLNVWLPEGTDNNLDQVKWIKVTYSAIGDFRLSLPQEPLSSTGETFGTTLPATTGEETVLLKLSDFKKPDWSTNTTDLDLSAVTDLSFEPIVSYGGGNASITVSSVIIYNYQGDMVALSGAMGTKESLFTTSVVNKQLFLTVANSGTVDVKLFTPQGRLVLSKKVGVHEGAAAVSLPGDMAGGIYILQCTAAQNVITQRLMLK